MKKQMIVVGIGAYLAVFFVPHAGRAIDVAPQNCSQLDVNLSPPFSTWPQIPTGILAAASPDKLAATVIPVGKKYFVELEPESSVNLVLPPSGAMKSNTPHAGMLSLRIPSDGTYRVLVGKRGRIDIVAGGEILQSIAYGENFPCFSLKKFVAFPVKAGDVTLELSSVADNTIEVMVVREP